MYGWVSLDPVGELGKASTFVVGVCLEAPLMQNINLSFNLQNLYFYFVIHYIIQYLVEMPVRLECVTKKMLV